MTTNLQEDQVEPVPVLEPRVGSARFDWVMILLCSWLLGGVYIDGWAHNHFTIIDTFFTPWHAVLYSGFLAVALFLVLTLMRNLVKGYAWWSALPPGYGLSLLGVVVFGIGGIGDFFWHTLLQLSRRHMLVGLFSLIVAGGGLVVAGSLVLRRSRTGTAALLSSDSGPTVFYAYSPQATMSVPVLLHRADSVVDSVAWSPNGKIVASANADGTVQLWSATSKASTSPDTPLFTYRKHRKAVTDLAWSVDGNYIASAGADGTAQVWSASTGASLLTYRGHTGPVLAIVWSPDGNQVASAGADKTVQIWNASTGTLIHIYRGHIDRVVALAWSSDGKRLASASVKGIVRVLDASSAALISTFQVDESHGNTITIVWSPNGRYLASARRTLSVWEASTGTLLFLYQDMNTDIMHVGWSPNGKHFATGQADGTIYIWAAFPSANTTTALPSFGEGHVRLGSDLALSGGEGSSLAYFILSCEGHVGTVNAVAWSPDGEHVVSAADDQTIQIWDSFVGNTLITYQNNFSSAIWSPDGNRIASARAKGTVQILDVATGTTIVTYKGHPKGSTITSLAWSPNGKQMLSASDDGTVLIWDVAKGTPLLFFAKQGQGIAGVSWLSGGKNIALMDGSGTIEVWDATTGDTLAQSKKPKMEVEIAVWSPDNRRVAVVDKYGQVQIWDAVKGTILLPPLIYLRGVQNIAWAPNGKQIVSSGGGIVQLWDATTGDILFTSQEGNQYSTAGLAWAPNSQYFAFTSDQGVQVWDITRGTLLLTYYGLTGGPDLIFTVSWAPDGKRIASASGDGTVQVWLAFPA